MQLIILQMTLDRHSGSKICEWVSDAQEVPSLYKDIDTYYCH